MSKRKPNYNPTFTMQELLTAVCDFYGDPIDDRNNEDPDHHSLHDVASQFDITVMKARKLLITGGMYSTALSRRVQELHAQGLSVAQITEETGLKCASINSYLPYVHIIYNLPDISIEAERQKQYRVRQRNNTRTDAEKEEKLWQEMIYLQGCLFTTSKGLDFTYKIHGGEMFVDRQMKKKARIILLKRPLTNLKSEEADRTGVRAHSLHPDFFLEGDEEPCLMQRNCVRPQKPAWLALCQSGTNDARGIDCSGFL